MDRKSINRNILECKSVYVNLVHGSASLVLIETYWNVNSVAIFLYLQTTHRINRNILECKFV